ncbi:MAG: O-antigen ligase, partial [Maribacter sp.]
MIPNIDIKKVFRLKETSIPDSSLWLFGGLALSILFSVILAIFFDELLLLAIPAGLLLVYQTIVDYKKVFYLFLFSIPLSTEYYFPNGFSTDLPTEPLVVGLMLAYGLFVLMRWQSMKRDFLLHPITLFLLFHIAWLALTVVTSANIVISLKFLLAKIWYVAVCYFLAGSILKTEKDIKKFFWIIFIPFIIAVVITLYRHSTYNFSFE